MRQHNYIDITGEWGANGSGWKTIDLSDYIPDLDGDETAVSIFILNRDSSVTRTVGAKHPSDTNPIAKGIRARMSSTFTAGINTSKEVDVYLHYAHSDCFAYITATYGPEAVMLRDADQLAKSQIVVDTFEEWDLSSIVPDGVRWVFIDVDGIYYGGLIVRPKGSSYDRGSNYQNIHMGFCIPCSTDRIVETHARYITPNSNFRLVGYLTGSTENVKLDPTRIGIPGTGGTYATLDLSGETIPADAKQAVFATWASGTTGRNYFIRTAGAGVDIPQANIYAYNKQWASNGVWPVPLSQAQEVEASCLTVNIPYLDLWGFLQGGGGAPLLPAATLMMQGDTI